MSNPPNRNPAFQAAVKRMTASPPQPKQSTKKADKKPAKK